MGTKLIIGADRGIAHAMSRHLHARGEVVLAGCLGAGDDLAELGIVVEPGVDVTSDEAITGLAKRLEQRGTRLDWLVNVAGVMGLDTLDTVDYEDVRRQFEINTIGPLRVVRELRGLLGEGSKVGILTSRVGSLGDNSSGGDYAYRILEGRSEHGRAQPAPRSVQVRDRSAGPTPGDGHDLPAGRG